MLAEQYPALEAEVDKSYDEMVAATLLVSKEASRPAKENAVDALRASLNATCKEARQGLSKLPSPDPAREAAALKLVAARLMSMKFTQAFPAPQHQQKHPLRKLGAVLRSGLGHVLNHPKMFAVRQKLQKGCKEARRHRHQGVWYHLVGANHDACEAKHDTLSVEDKALYEANRSPGSRPGQRSSKQQHEQHQQPHTDRLATADCGIYPTLLDLGPDPEPMVAGPCLAAPTPGTLEPEICVCTDDREQPTTYDHPGRRYWRANESAAAAAAAAATPAAPAPAAPAAPAAPSLSPDQGQGQGQGLEHVLTITSWPELVGRDATEGKRLIEADSGISTVVCLPEGSPITFNYMKDRVRLFTTPDGKIAETPCIG